MFPTGRVLQATLMRSHLNIWVEIYRSTVMLLVSRIQERDGKIKVRFFLKAPQILLYIYIRISKLARYKSIVNHANKIQEKGFFTPLNGNVSFVRLGSFCPFLPLAWYSNCRANVKIGCSNGAEKASVCSLHFLWLLSYGYLTGQGRCKANLFLNMESFPFVSGFLKILPLQNLPRNVGCHPGGPNLNFVPPIVAPWEAMDRYWRRIDGSIHKGNKL